jgi:hypothetical protein
MMMKKIQIKILRLMSLMRSLMMEKVEDEALKRKM